MVMVPNFSNFPDELSENDELGEHELNGSDCNQIPSAKKFYNNHQLVVAIKSLCDTATNYIL